MREDGTGGIVLETYFPRFAEIVESAEASLRSGSH